MPKTLRDLGMGMPKTRGCPKRCDTGAPGPGVWDLIWEVRCLNHFGDSRSHYPDLDVVEVGE